MELNEIKEFFAEYDNIPQEKKDELAKFLLGIAMLSSDSDKVADVIFSEKDFEVAYKELTETITKDEKFVDKFGILKRLEDNKELLSKIRKYYALKKEVASISEPLGFYGTLLNGFKDGGSFGFLALMSLLTINRSTVPSDIAINTSKI